MRNTLRFSLLLVLSVVLVVATDARNKDAGKEKGRTGSPAVTRTTSITSGTVIFEESFEDTLFPPAGWTMKNHDGNIPTGVDSSDTSWYQSFTVGGAADPPLEVYDGEAMAAAYYGTANEFLLDDWLVTSNTGGTAPAGAVDSLIFYVASRLSSSGYYADSLEVLVSTTDRNVGSFTRLTYIEAPKDAWKRVALLLPQATTRYIAFRYLLYDGGPSGTNSDKVVIDKVQIVQYTPTAVGTTKPDLPSKYALSQNYPNPFNPSTTIEFALPAESYTRIKVYNLLGAEVATVLERVLPAGNHSIPFNAAGLPSGLYFYTMNAGSFTATRTMVLMK
jgi:hypothetical protein